MLKKGDLLSLLKKIVNPKALFVLILFLLFFFKGLAYLDPDFGWRIKAGEHYWRYGIPEADIFTYTMPDFPWVDHAWGVSLIFYLVYTFMGYPVLVFLMTLPVIYSLLIVSKNVSRFDFKNSVYKKLIFFFNSKSVPGVYFKLNLKDILPFSFIPLVLVSSILFTFFGVRAQVIGWLMFSLIIYWISDEKVFKKFKFLIPAFFLLWVNLHGSFALGIVSLCLFLLLKTLQTRKVLTADNFIGLFSLLLTIINPYGIGVWREVWSSASDPKLRLIISEWMPALTMFDLAMVFLICLSLTFIWKYRKNYNKFELFLFLFLFIQAVSSRRQLPLWAIFTFSLCVKGIYFFHKDLKKLKEGYSRFGKVYKTAWVLSIIIFIIQALFSYKEAIYVGRGNFYPVSAVSYLSKNVPKGEIFSDYGWGGYLILNLPQKKVFIDGRMPSWRWNPENSSDLSSAFDTYNQILSGEVDYGEFFNRFGVDTVLTRKVSEVSEHPLYLKAENFLTFFGWEKNDFEFLKLLEEDEWMKVYEDEVSVIYKKE